jgi:hypothetical protein
MISISDYIAALRKEIESLERRYELNRAIYYRELLSAAVKTKKGMEEMDKQKSLQFEGSGTRQKTRLRCLKT